MDGLATASPHIGAATASQGQQLPLTFTYTTPGDIQGLEPSVRGGAGGGPRQHPNIHGHGVQQIQGIQPVVQRQPQGMVIAAPQPTSLSMNASRPGEGGPCVLCTFSSIQWTRLSQAACGLYCSACARVSVGVYTGEASGE